MRIGDRRQSEPQAEGYGGTLSFGHDQSRAHDPSRRRFSNICNILTGSYKPPREFNWVIGVFLLLLTLLLSFTGYLLPWDQEAYWGIATLSPSASSETAVLDGSDLLTAYVLHTVALPLMVAGMTLYHLRRARRDAATPARSSPPWKR